MFRDPIERNKIAIDFLKQGRPMEEISRYTGLTIEELTQLKANIKW
jgi:hypothetical protein